MQWGRGAGMVILTPLYCSKVQYSTKVLGSGKSTKTGRKWTEMQVCKKSDPSNRINIKRLLWPLKPNPGILTLETCSHVQEILCM